MLSNRPAPSVSRDPTADLVGARETVRHAPGSAQIAPNPSFDRRKGACRAASARDE